MLHRPFNCPLRLFFTPFFILIFSTVIVEALVNVTVERDDPAILYFPNGEWREMWPGVKTSGSLGANATLNFTGVAVYYEAWLWTEPTLLVAQVDAILPITIDLTDHGRVDGDSVPTTPVEFLIASGLADVQHTITVGRPDGQRATIIGRFIYSTDNPPAPSPSKVASTRTLPPSSASPSATASSSKVSLQIYPAIFGTLGFLMLVLAAVIFYVRRRRRQRTQQRQGSIDRFTLARSRVVLKKGGSELEVSPLHRSLDLDPHIVIATPITEKAEREKWQID